MLAPSGFVQLILAFVLAPMLLSIINRTKAAFAGRHGPRWLQPYWDLWKLLHKGAVYSRTVTAVFVAGPIVGLAATGLALCFIPVAGSSALVSFPGDFLLVAYLLGLARFLTVSAALDTGSSFEGMGASREVLFSTLAEPALLVSLITLAAASRGASLTAIYAGIDSAVLASAAGPAMFLVMAALFVVLLCENARIPIDDPTTHLELTMIHEVMVLDHGGPDLAMIHYAASLKLWLFGALLVGAAMPLRSGFFLVDLFAGLLGLAAVAVLIGVVESVMARLRLVRVPQFLVAASVLAVVALVLVMR